MQEERIDALKKELIGFAGHVESMIEKSVAGLLNRDHDTLVAVTKDDESKANTYELTIDELCIRLIAQYEPKARDLRTILMVMKMNNDLERMADHAVNIAESGLFLVERPPVKPLIDIPRMAEETVKMMSDSVRAFINEDAALAKSVCERDNIVDNLADQIQRELATYMANDAATVDPRPPPPQDIRQPRTHRRPLHEYRRGCDICGGGEGDQARRCMI